MRSTGKRTGGRTARSKAGLTLYYLFGATLSLLGLVYCAWLFSAGQYASTPLGSCFVLGYPTTTSSTPSCCPSVSTGLPLVSRQALLRLIFRPRAGTRHRAIRFRHTPARRSAGVLRQSRTRRNLQVGSLQRLSQLLARLEQQWVVGIDRVGQVQDCFGKGVLRRLTLL